MFATRLFPVLLAPILAYSQTTTSLIVCVPGQCLQGTSNVTIGARLNTPTGAMPVHLLPGQYTDQTSPQYLHDVLTNPSVSIAASVGFVNSTSLPLNLQLQNGFSIYEGPLYSSQAAFTGLPEAPVVNASVPLNAKALAISNNLVATITAGSNKRITLWEPVPDISQLPASVAGALSLNNLESVACSPACSNAGLCTVAGKCLCAAAFAGASCEQCLPGFFGPKCQPCPSNCDTCDQGISGTGRCLKPTIPNKPSTCNCVNGVCGANGQCECTTGFEAGADGVACGKCASGFFRSSTGDCKVCGLGCNQCEDTTGTCTSCRPGFTQDGSDKSICNAPAQVRSNGQVCPAGSFGNGADCGVCNSACDACTGPSANDCSSCARGTIFLNGVCVTPNSDGVCAGSNRIADNVRKECDSCGAKCTSCRIPNFSQASIISARQCTGCIAGFFLSNGECVETCPDGTFVGSDLKSCQACDSSCRTCSDSANSCIACANNQLAAAGRCVDTCPAGTFQSSSASSCTTCHPDCASCSGGEFNQCTACPADRPVLLNGRCLPTCTKTQFFDAASGTCQACDSSCSSCFGPGPANCAACSSATQVLRQGSCVAANCAGSANVVPGLGVCLSELVVVASSGEQPIAGIDTPTKKSKGKLEWWQILLMALGCAFILLVVIWLLRRRQKKKRAEKTRMFGEGVKKSGGWRWRMVRFGEKVFGHKRSAGWVGVLRRAFRGRGRRLWLCLMERRGGRTSLRLNELREAEEARGNMLISPPMKLVNLKEERERGSLIISPPMRNVGLRERDDLVDLGGSEPRKAPKPPRPITEISMFPSSSPAGYYMNPPACETAERCEPDAPSTRQPVKRELVSKFSMDTLGVPQEHKRSRNPFRK
ncbi:TNFR/NGFR cysteine-rich region family protein [Ephemerocybe angulata]|uniref:TNFR/NGFR cysteine-rich region family protein n=1 Tax=Ephemerocybe angulata TaxID=980116 RepID=A0A8H6M9B1_9AGAR|nr:TNFR/NGFR cysteine-rich region family protein [Tulosesus angulatus]